MSENNVEKKSKIKIVIMVVALLILVGGGAFAGYYFSQKGKQANNTPQPNNQQMASSVNVNQNSGYVRNIVPSNTFEAGEFLVNLSDEESRRFVKTKVYLGYENKKLAKELEQKKPIILDAINSVLRSKKSTDFNEKGVEKIKLEILEKVNTVFQNGRCETVYFTELIIQ
ncbi:flagellar basal body protein FliL [Clostridium cochlearium]|uniref:Flagellar protein FliL n=1 Tax=Clostridium cochlearium TaxID=1494 RepID=A0ABY0QKG2_CLOCO|nr:flagellar basal body-associated FliL family protein [Clostridium cochlearium]NME94907.1 flagellar basal body protein FliL [Clostridium cochlearium]SDL06261.1 flagellar FliL protein/chemotaxis protein MotB [Clostridium cochlearium]